MSFCTRVHGCVLFLLVAACGGPDEPITQPELMPDPSPFVYPTKLWDQHMRGETLLLVHVTSAGEVDSVAVSNSSGHAEFDSAAVTGASGHRAAIPSCRPSSLPTPCAGCPRQRTSAVSTAGQR